MVNHGFMVTKSRASKAKKIEAVLRDALKPSCLKGIKILDVGCGNGEILAWFSRSNEVSGCDTENKIDESISRKIKFKLVSSMTLPFEDETFDVIISNHVIEHVFDQSKYMSEIKRVMKFDGVCYFSTPNRNFPIEPHYKIPFIHYLPNRVFDFILKKMGVYHESLNLLSHNKMIQLIGSAGFNLEEYTGKILKHPKSFEWDGFSLSFMPVLLINRFVFISQTNIFILRKHR